MDDLRGVGFEDESGSTQRERCLICYALAMRNRDAHQRPNCGHKIWIARIARVVA